jgi:hypothetical protein
LNSESSVNLQISDIVSGSIGVDQVVLPIIATFFGRSIPLLAILSACELPLARRAYGPVNNDWKLQY